MKFWNFISEHMAEISLIIIVLFALISMPIAFLTERTEATYNVILDSAQIINVKLVNDSSAYVSDIQ